MKNKLFFTSAIFVIALIFIFGVNVPITEAIITEEKTLERDLRIEDDLRIKERNIYDSQGNIIRKEVSREGIEIEEEPKIPESKGFIVQFEKDPILVKKKQLEKIAEANKKYVEEAFILSPIRFFKKWFSLMPEDVNTEVKKYSEDLKTDNEEVKQRILNKIVEKRGKINGGLIKRFFSRITGETEKVISDLGSEIVMNEFKNTFNGIALDISGEESKEIKKIKGVKEVYSNLTVQATLGNSVPLINADDVWKLDEDGNNCQETGKPCLTGEGTTIAIIDTGVDYTHKDLGCENDDRCGNIIWPYIPILADLKQNRVVWQDIRNGNFDIYLYDLLLNKEVQITTDPFFQEYPSIYENKVIWTDNRNGKYDIYMCDLEGNTGDITRWCNTLMPEGGLKRINYDGENWEPSIYDNKIVFAKKISAQLYHLNIFMYDISTNQEIQITDSNCNDREPSIYEDKIVWMDCRNGKYDIYMCDLEGNTGNITEWCNTLMPKGGLKPICTNLFDLDESNPLIYKDRVIWTGSNERGGKNNIYIYDLSTNQQIPVTSSDIINHASPSIYEDKIVWTDNRNGKYDIFFCDLEGNTGDITRWCNTLMPEGGLKQITDISNQYHPLIYEDKIIWLDYRSVSIYGAPQLYYYNLFSEEEKQITGFDIDTDIEELFPNNKVIGGYDFFNNDSNPLDDYGHGTHCAGIAAGSGEGGLKGVAPGAKLYAYKVLNSLGNGYWDDIIAGIERAVDPNQDGDFSDMVDVISLSLGGKGNPDDALSQAIDNAVESGVIAVVAAGNDGPGLYTIGSPGTAREAITVGATDKSDSIANFSSRGPVEWVDSEGNQRYLIKPDIVAPGVSICSAQWDGAWNDKECFDDKHVAISGTSMATPHVAGAAALLKQKNPDWISDEIKMALRSKAIDIGKNINEQGYGRLDVLNTINFNGIPCIAKIEIFDNGNRTINIIGTAMGRDFNRYTLYYGEGDNPSQWNEILSGTSPVENSILYENFDTKRLPEGINYFKLVVWNSLREASEDISIIWVYSDCLEGWPVSLEGEMNVNPIIVDLDNNGENEVIVESWGGYIYVIHADGSIATEWNWPKVNNLLQSTIVLGDIDNDGDLEIFQAQQEHSPQRLVINAWHHDGSSLEGWPITAIVGNYLSDGISLADINNDGFLDILASYRDGGLSDCLFRDKGVFAWNPNGTTIEGWPVQLGGECGPFFPPSIGDIDGDGEIEIVVGTADNGFKPLTGPWGIYAFNHDGSIVNGFPIMLQGEIFCPIVLGDIDNDNKLEIISCAIDRYGIDFVYVLEGDGSIENNWPKQAHCSTLSLGDINNNGYLEIITSGGSWATYAFNHNGSLVSGWPVYGTNTAYEPAVIGDITGDGNVEILIRRNDEKVYAYRSNGSPVFGWPKITKDADWGVQAGLALGDLDTDGDIEVVVPYKGGIIAWDLDTPYNLETIDWPMFQHDPQHTGCYDCKLLCEDECSEGETKCSDDTHQQTCGNYDEDECLEWGGDVDCGTDFCEDWQENYCFEEDVYHLRTCHHKGCADSSCFDETNEEKELVQDCGEDSCDDWGDAYCKDNAIYHSRTCYDRGCSDNTCFDNRYEEEEKIQDCPSENFCLNGNCVLACTDSDEGKDYYVKGRVDWVNEVGGYGSMNDYCNGDTIIEAYCLNSDPVWSSFICPYGCENGACKPSPQPSVTVISPNGGERWEVGKAYDIKWTSSNLAPEKLLQIYLERKLPTDNQYWNILTIANMQTQSGSYKWVVPIDLETNALYKIGISEMGESGLEKTDESDDYFSIVEPTVGATCTDSDEGKDYYVKGQVDWVNEVGGYGSMNDYCNGDTIIEAYCLNNRPVWSSFICPYGCENGACKQTGVSCTDSDGGEDYYMKGRVLITEDGVPVPGKDATDYCTDGGVMEYICMETNAGYWEMFYQCPNGCENGACKRETATCTDSDGGKDYYVKGRVDWVNEVGGYGSMNDYCNGDTIIEAYCLNSDPVWSSFICPNGCENGACKSVVYPTITLKDIEDQLASIFNTFTELINEWERLTKR